MRKDGYFAILHETERYGQILIIKDYNTESETNEIIFKFELEDVMISFSIGNIKDEEKANKVFKSYEIKDNAINIIETIIKEL